VKGTGKNPADRLLASVKENKRSGWLLEYLVKTVHRSSILRLQKLQLPPQALKIFLSLERRLGSEVSISV
jgi:hypothetical protein